MGFDSAIYGPAVARILALNQDGNRLIPLVASNSPSEEARRLLRASPPAALFPNAPGPEAAVGGLWLYFSCGDECHEIVQSLDSSDGSFWHAILHRQEPDSGNAAYWFRRVGQHPIFPKLQRAASEVIGRYPQASFRMALNWDPFAFIRLCEDAREQPGSQSMEAALEIQRAEWQLLFDHCARPRL